MLKPTPERIVSSSSNNSILSAPTTNKHNTHGNRQPHPPRSDKLPVRTTVHVQTLKIAEMATESDEIPIPAPVMEATSEANYESSDAYAISGSSEADHVDDVDVPGEFVLPWLHMSIMFALSLAIVGILDRALFGMFCTFGSCIAVFAFNSYVIWFKAGQSFSIGSVVRVEGFSDKPVRYMTQLIAVNLLFLAVLHHILPENAFTGVALGVICLPIAMRTLALLATCTYRKFGLYEEPEAKTTSTCYAWVIIGSFLALCATASNMFYDAPLLLRVAFFSSPLFLLAALLNRSLNKKSKVTVAVREPDDDDETTTTTTTLLVDGTTTDTAELMSTRASSSSAAGPLLLTTV